MKKDDGRSLSWRQPWTGVPGSAPLLDLDLYLNGHYMANPLVNAQGRQLAADGCGQRAGGQANQLPKREVTFAMGVWKRKRF